MKHPHRLRPRRPRVHGAGVANDFRAGHAGRFGRRPDAARSEGSATRRPAPTTTPPTSSIGGGVDTPLRDIPQSVTVINSTLMQAQGATSLADALRNVPGITMGAAEGGSIGNNFNLRGFSARTDLYLDGMRDRGQFYRDVFSLDSVEVLQGPSSMLFGRGSTGGVINQVSKVPTPAPFATATVIGGTQPSFRATTRTSTCPSTRLRRFGSRRWDSTSTRRATSCRTTTTASRRLFRSGRHADRNHLCRPC